MHYEFYARYPEELITGSQNAEQLNSSLIGKFNDTSVLRNGRALVERLKTGGANISYFEVLYPGVLVGMGYPHEISKEAFDINEKEKRENVKGQINCGIMLDYVTGDPYIPGTTIKGIIAHMLRLAAKNDDVLEYIKSIAKLGDEFDSKAADKFVEKYLENGDVFFDAFWVGKKKGTSTSELVGIEHITPQLNPIKNPVPISMLKIMPGSVIAIGYGLISEENPIVDADKRAEIYKAILKANGVGAKTNVGFGIIEDINENAIYIPEKKDTGLNSDRKTSSNSHNNERNNNGGARSNSGASIGVCVKCGNPTDKNAKTGEYFRYCRKCNLEYKKKQG